MLQLRLQATMPFRWTFVTVSLFIIISVSGSIDGLEMDEEDVENLPRNILSPKMMPIFSVVRFPNDICPGANRNGTCYTSEECDQQGGVTSGSCAEGFGVCCIFTLSCGGTSSQNCTYLVQAAQTTFTMSQCSFEICKCSSNICRIRYDFTTLEIDGPVTDTTAVAGAILTGEAVGDCDTDSLTFTGANGGPPVICGFNTGQHLYVDATDDCHKANINIATATSVSRTWDIKVTQHVCGSDSGGPPGCLQYFTGDSGSVSSFNFPASTVGETATHLSNQDYTMCFRRSSGNCYICFLPTPAGTAAVIDQDSFGLSISPDAAAQSSIDSECTTDYLEIVDGNTIVIAAMNVVNAGFTRFCGRFLNTATALTESISICTRRTPFNLRFVTDANEVIAAAGIGTAITSENTAFPGGIIGFRLNYVQKACA